MCIEWNFSETKTLSYKEVEPFVLMAIRYIAPAERGMQGHMVLLEGLLRQETETIIVDPHL